MKKKENEKGLKIRSYLTGVIWGALGVSMVLSALLFAVLSYFFNLPKSIPAIGWLLIFNTLISGVITAFLNGKILAPITKLSQAMTKVSEGDFTQQLQTSSRIKEISESCKSFNIMTSKRPSMPSRGILRCCRGRNFPGSRKNMWRKSYIIREDFPGLWGIFCCCPDWRIRIFP